MHDGVVQMSGNSRYPWGCTAVGVGGGYHAGCAHCKHLAEEKLAAGANATHVH